MELTSFVKQGKEQAMVLAKEKGCSKVVAFSRPAQFRLHLAKALDDSIPFEPHKADEFAGFAKRLLDGARSSAV